MASLGRYYIFNRILLFIVLPSLLECKLHELGGLGPFLDSYILSV